MKKLLFVLALGAFVAACNSGTNDTTNTDSTTVSTDTTTMAPAPMDTTTHMDSTGATGADTTVH